MADVSQYAQLITHEHQKPNFLAWLSSWWQGQVDAQNLLATFPEIFDLDVAIGNQLDILGLWIGVTRVLEIPLTGVYFSFDTADLGWDQGLWFGPGANPDVVYELDDDSYRILLRAKIAANSWDGTIPDAYRVWAIAFGPLGYTLLLQDNQDMSLDVIVLGPALSAVMKALLTSGNLDLKPAGVRINGYWQGSLPGAPLFAFDSNTPALAGWDEGAWIVPI
jgi:hypothetical protein